MVDARLAYVFYAQKSPEQTHCDVGWSAWCLLWLHEKKQSRRYVFAKAYVSVNKNK